MPYNPFDKPISEVLTDADLQDLIGRSVAEGYYVEFKGDTFPNNDKIGRSIASLANTYGGWYIVGVKTDAHNVANEICGFSLAAFPDPISKVREIVKSHIDPVPIFFPQVIELEGGTAALVVYVPPNQETPFITKDGRIYRRAHDSSDPVPEASRYTIDRLVDDGRRLRKQFVKFCRDERSMSKNEAETISWVNMFIAPYPSGLDARVDLMDEGGISKLLEGTRTLIDVHLTEQAVLKGTLSFNVGRPTLNSVILEQLDLSKSAFNSLSAELFYDGRARFFIPLHYVPRGFDGRLRDIESTEVSELLSSMDFDTRPSDASYLKFFDVARLSIMMYVLTSFYQHWLGEESSVVDFRCGLTIEDAWRAVPFLDMDQWAAHVRRFGMPVMKTNGASFPRGIGRGFFVDRENKSALGRAFFEATMLAFGLPYGMHHHVLSHAITKSSTYAPSSASA